MSGNGKLKLEVILAAVDRVTKPLRAIREGSGGVARALKAAKDELRRYNSEQGKITGYNAAIEAARKASAAVREHKVQLAELTTKLAGAKAAQEGMRGAVNQARADYKLLMQQFARDDSLPGLAYKLQKARDELVKTEGDYAKVVNAGRRYQRQVKDETRALDEAKTAKDRQSDALKRLVADLNAAGIGTKHLESYQAALKTNIGAANNAIEAQRKKLQALDAARAAYDKSLATRNQLAASGIGMSMAGAGMMLPVKGSIDEASHFATEIQRINALGLGEHASQDAVKFAKAMKTYGTSAAENLELVRDAMTIFADEHHAQMVAPTLAKMKFANEALYGEHGAEKNKQFMDMLKVIELRQRGPLTEEKFKHEADLVQKVLTATGGRVGPEQWRGFIARGGVAAKMLDEKSFFYRMEPLIQEMGSGDTVGQSLMSAYQALYQGKTTVRAARYAQDLGLYQKGMVEYDKVGQLKRVKPGALTGADLYLSNPQAWLESVLLPALAKKGITSDKDVVNAIGTVFSNRAASGLFATMYLQRAQIEKNARVNEGADSIDALNAKARQTPHGVEIDLLAKKRNLYREMGEKVLPLYVEGLEKTRNLLAGITEFMEKHPALAKSMAVGFMGLAGGVLILGGLFTAAAAVIGPLALLKLGVAQLGISGGAAAAGLWAVLRPVLAVGAAFYAGWKAGEWLNEGINALLSRWLGYKTTLGASIYDLVQYVSGLTSHWIDAGRQMIDGLIVGIKERWAALKDAVAGIADSTVTWLKDKLGIHSPSQVFAEIGGHSMAGLEVGLLRGQDGPLAAVMGAAKQLAAAGSASLVMNGAALAMPPDAARTIGETYQPAALREIGNLTRTITDRHQGIDLPAVPDVIRNIGVAYQPAALPAIDARAPLSSASAGASAAGGNTYIFQIHAAPGMDENALAQAVERKIRQLDAERDARRRSRLTDSD